RLACDTPDFTGPAAEWPYSSTEPVCNIRIRAGLSSCLATRQGTDIDGASRRGTRNATGNGGRGAFASGRCLGQESPASLQHYGRRHGGRERKVASFSACYGADYAPHHAHDPDVRTSKFSTTVSGSHGRPSRLNRSRCSSALVRQAAWLRRYSRRFGS